MTAYNLPLVFVVLLVFSEGVGADTLTGRVVRVVDGDTVVLLLSGNVQERIRLSGIDCPERKQAFGTRAKEAPLRSSGKSEIGGSASSARSRPCASVGVATEVRWR
jgi:endonuclease YncB( thermonuclease family)